MKKNLALFLFFSLYIIQMNAQPTVRNKMYTYKNLSIFVLESKNQTKNQYLSLEQALKQKKIKLSETGTVGELAVTNKSSNYVFVMAGDIVKGGKQDRTIGLDLVLNPNSKNVPLKSFCVEQSRWRQRGSESVSQFSGSSQSLSNRNLKLAARESSNQSAVWSEVSNYQTKASQNVKTNVQSKESATSLQLTLENKELRSTVQDYAKALQPAFNENPDDIVGFVFCINGKISTAEWFENAQLFSSLQKKLMESAINEAIFDYDEKQEAKSSLTVNEIETFIRQAAKGKEEIAENSDYMLEKKYKTESSIMFSTFNKNVSTNIPIHVSIYSTEGITPVSDTPQLMNQRMININQMPSGLIKNR